MPFQAIYYSFQVYSSQTFASFVSISLSIHYFNSELKYAKEYSDIMFMDIKQGFCANRDTRTEI